MAITGIEIFKLLPKTNCKKCGFPTCLAFAMKVAQGQADIEQCPEASEEVKAKLKEAATPPIRGFVFGSKNTKIKIGEETVLFRHEKKFFNPTVLALEIKDTESNIDGFINEVLESSIERVGQILKVDAIFLKNESENSEIFNQVLDKIINKAFDLPLILGISKPEVAAKALEKLKESRPILSGATPENINEMSEIAKKYNVPLIISDKGIEKVLKLVEIAHSVGVQDLVIDTQPNSAKELLMDNTLIRRASLKKGIRLLGYPIITFANRDDNFYETVIASLAILKYSSIVVLSSIPKWKNLVLFTLKQNIYSDPQVPMQVKQDIYKVGEPDENSPIIVTTNFALTYFLVKGEIENSKVPAWLAIMDCDGLSVLTAWAAGKFSASKIAQFIKESGIEEKLNHKELIIPGYVAMLKGAVEDKLPGWKVIVGTKEASGIPAFLRNYVRSKK
ncbi:acetyl-CoA decarbonylase/synthase complex subunit gamma [Thermodesulfovibrio yellowstonii]|jgi:acetyl-CoA decarbonylase/synthase complex subunit gamma|uniref:Acetyl-CoA decarbonylase/synthase complex gamma subunit n=1 Tax=Thermodesulfovibrio yellowstonii (strain ATCC 51303 / DSM 11347 / YP87) TaxID=289376 RepID=B5YG70_THEYD|nr:acetyl-CoA decarbonylase/synthase complex subunit gamma [Thermodesulfovibrio yellowstonii]ACI20806.1 acetyl-CoA decarbonylase/synthase complex gamma subunit [Thermodesulfovibrio yellowstonii DSM 11347]